MATPVIKSNSVMKSGAKYVQLIRVCNESNRTESLWVTSWPWMRNGNKPKNKIANQKTGQKVTLRKGQCKTLRFVHSKKPYQYYTDLYRYKATGNNQGFRFGFDVDIVQIFDLDAFIEQLRKAMRWSFWLLAFLPYPMGLEPGGKRKRFVIRGVRGLPEGWKATRAYPAFGKPVTLGPDRKNYQLLLQITANKADSEIERLDLTIEAEVAGERRSPLNRIPIGLTAVRKHSLPTIVDIDCVRDPKYPHLEFTVDVEDESGLLETPEILYSTDGGRSWEQEDMELVDAVAFSDLGLSAAKFRAWVPLPSMRATALAGFVANDQFGNSNSTPIARWPKRSRNR